MAVIVFLHIMNTSNTFQLLLPGWSSLWTECNSCVAGLYTSLIMEQPQESQMEL